MCFVNRHQGFWSSMKGIPFPRLMECFLAYSICGFQWDFWNLKIRESSSFSDHQVAPVWKRFSVSETGRRWEVLLISLSLVRVSALSLLIYPSHNVWVNVLDHGLVIQAKTNMLVYPEGLSNSLDCWGLHILLILFHSQLGWEMLIFSALTLGLFVCLFVYVFWLHSTF